MDTMQAFMRGQAAQGNRNKVFDWDKAAQMLKDSGAQNADAGLSEDMNYTCGTILEDGKIPENHYCYLSSNWATPVIVIEDNEEECWKYEDETEWDAGTYWPETAKKIFGIV